MVPASTTASFTRHGRGGPRPVRAAWNGQRGSRQRSGPGTPTAPSGARRCREPAIYDAEVAWSETIDLKAEGTSFALRVWRSDGRSLGKVTQIAVQARQSRALPRVGRRACLVKERQVSTGMKDEETVGTDSLLNLDEG